MKYSTESLQAEIKRRSPWYQCIPFPEFGVSTTDNPENSWQDMALDNMIGDITIEEAARLRPRPKWNFISGFLPEIEGLDILEIGCNCGFFSFEFARMGAKSIVGLDVSPKWLENAEWARQVLEYQNVRFFNCDFMRFDGGTDPLPGLLSKNDSNVALPNDRFDLVFMSTVLDHLFFPLFSIYKMCRISRKWVVIDVPTARAPEGENIARLAIAPDNSHHGFTFSIDFLVNYIQRLGVPYNDIHVHTYNNNQSVTYVIDVSRMSEGLNGA